MRNPFDFYGGLAKHGAKAPSIRWAVDVDALRPCDWAAMSGLVNALAR